MYNRTSLKECTASILCWYSGDEGTEKGADAVEAFIAVGQTSSVRMAPRERRPIFASLSTLRVKHESQTSEGTHGMVGHTATGTGRFGDDLSSTSATVSESSHSLADADCIPPPPLPPQTALRPRAAELRLVAQAMIELSQGRGTPSSHALPSSRTPASHSQNTITTGVRAARAFPPMSRPQSPQQTSEHSTESGDMRVKNTQTFRREIDTANAAHIKRLRDDFLRKLLRKTSRTLHGFVECLLCGEQCWAPNGMNAFSSFVFVERALQWAACARRMHSDGADAWQTTN